MSLLAPLHAQTVVWSESGIPGATGGTSLAYGQGVFVGVFTRETEARLAWSTDGEAWTLISQPTGVGPLLFVDGHFYFGVWSQVYSSSDGKTWSAIHSPAQGSSSGFQYAATDGRSLLFATQHRLQFSADRSLFTSTAALPDLQPERDGRIESVAAFAGRYYVAYAPEASAPTRVVSTGDGGLTWRTDLVNLPHWANLVAGNGRLLVGQGDHVLLSRDGSTFERADLPPDGRYTSIHFAGGRFLIARSPLWSSLDGVHWTGALSGTSPPSFIASQLAFGAGRYVLVGSRLEGFMPTTVKDVVGRITAPPPPLLTAQSTSERVAEGRSRTLSVSLANFDVSTSIRWLRDGVPIPGQTGPSLRVSNVRETTTYQAEISNLQGTVLSDPMTLQVVPAREGGRIINLSVLATLPTASDRLTLGFVVAPVARASRPMLVRAGGPSLRDFGVPSPLSDPVMVVFQNGHRIAENDDWGGASADAMTAVFASVGAYPYPDASSRDAALHLPALPAGPTTVQVSGRGEEGGRVLAEVYDALDPSNVTVDTPRLVNVSVLQRLLPGGSLTAGFVIQGKTPVRVVVRAVGPGLAPYGVGDALANPRLRLQAIGQPESIASNDDWSGEEGLQRAFEEVGAFQLDPGSRDAALVLTLPPGNYTADALAPAGEAGTVLVEVYEAP